RWPSGHHYERNAGIWMQTSGLPLLGQLSTKLTDPDGSDDERDDADTRPGDEERNGQWHGALQREEGHQNRLSVLQQEDDQRDHQDRGDADPDPSRAGAGA
ncbi:MAG TPA: hypothetical protein VFU98_19470, partial [Microlunatus sp.]|nr:hypothetical protein [Microlunatus sp.]